MLYRLWGLINPRSGARVFGVFDPIANLYCANEVYLFYHLGLRFRKILYTNRCTFCNLLHLLLPCCCKESKCWFCWKGYRLSISIMSARRVVDATEVTFCCGQTDRQTDTYTRHHQISRAYRCLGDGQGQTRKYLDKWQSLLASRTMNYKLTAKIFKRLAWFAYLFHDRLNKLPGE